MSPYAITKYTNELYASIFCKNYNLETIGLRYFNVFGKKQNHNSVYAAVIPKFIKLLANHESPTINGDGSYSRDFTYIENVIQMNHLVATTKNNDAIGQVFNTAVGEQNNLVHLVNLLKQNLSVFDSKIADVKINYGSNRKGDIPHSFASIEKAKNTLGYNPSYNLKKGLMEAVKWYWENL